MDFSKENPTQHLPFSNADSNNGASTDNSNPGKIFIGGLSRDATPDVFTKHFCKYGELTDSVIMKERVTRRPRGFGFVTYADPSVVDRVVQDKHFFNGRTVEIKRTIPRGSAVCPKIKKIFVGGIPTSISDDELKEYFAKFGKIVEHQIMKARSSGRSRGFGFVTFESERTVGEIISQRGMFELGGKQVEIQKAEPKKSLPGAAPVSAIGSRPSYFAGDGLEGPCYGRNVHRPWGVYGGYRSAEHDREYGGFYDGNRSNSDGTEAVNGRYCTGYGGSSLGNYGEHNFHSYGGQIESYNGCGSGMMGGTGYDSIAHCYG